MPIPSKAARYVFMKCVKLTEMREMREIDRKAAREKPKKKARITQEISWGFLCEVGGFHYDFSAFSRVIAVQDCAARKIVFLGPYCETCLSKLACTVFMAAHKGFSHLSSAAGSPWASSGRGSETAGFGSLALL